MSHILTTALPILKLNWFLACYDTQVKERRMQGFLPSSSDRELLTPPIPEKLFAKEWECPREEHVPSCTKLPMLRTWLQEWAAMVPEGPWSFSCVLPDRFKKEKANQRHWCPGWLVPLQEDGNVHSPQDSCFTGWDSHPPRVPKLSKKWKDHVLLCNPPHKLSASLLFSRWQGPWIAIALPPLTLGRLRSRGICVWSTTGHIGGSLFFVFFFPYNLTSRSTEQRKGMETLGIHCVAWYSCPLNALREPFFTLLLLLFFSLHHCLSFFFNKYCGSVSIIKPRAIQVLLIFVVLLWSRRRHRVFRNRAVFYITW